MPVPLPKITSAVRAVLSVFMTEPAADYYGYDILRSADLPSGTLYPMLARFERCGLVECYHENAELFEGAGRPPRRYYRLTRRGVEWAQTALHPAPPELRRSASPSPYGRPDDDPAGAALPPARPRSR